MGMLYEYDDAEHAVIASSHGDSVQAPHIHHLSEACQWWAETFPQHTKDETTQ